ncbi:hypothetical protein [Streptomyces sp. NPDC046939]|uniref:hypothetical protein n=1 Tax=Streptomyces sp. NPDC046939 TaxID=3155376 RepID=UPI0033D33EED
MKTIKLTSLAVAPLVLAGVAVAGPIAGATAASATPSDCLVGRPDSNTGYAICLKGTGQVRAKITCEDGINGHRYINHGPWVNVNQRSYAACGAAQRVTVVLVDYELR